jgi:hypothetical protein
VALTDFFSKSVCKELSKKIVLNVFLTSLAAGGAIQCVP